MTQEKTLRAKCRPRRFAINIGCRGHPCRGSVKPAQGLTFNKVICLPQRALDTSVGISTHFGWKFGKIYLASREFKAVFFDLDGTLETAMAFEGFALEKCYVSPEHKEYVSAFLEKRKPNFRKAKG